LKDGRAPFLHFFPSLFFSSPQDVRLYSLIKSPLLSIIKNKSDFSLIEFPVEEGFGVPDESIVARNSSAFVINDLDDVIFCGAAGSLACGEVMLFVV